MISGCATIINDEYQKVNVTTSTGKKVEGNIDGLPFEAPGIVSLKRSKSDKIMNTNNPKCNKTTIVSKSVDPIFFINILSGGVFGSTTDYATEKMWKYQDNILITCNG